MGLNRHCATSEVNLRQAFADLKGEIQVHLEAGELAPWAMAIISPLVSRVVCSHPAANAWIAKDGDKCIDIYPKAIAVAGRNALACGASSIIEREGRVELIVVPPGSRPKLL